MLIGIITGLQVARVFPAPPVFSDRFGRLTHYQSYENNYFASLRSFTEHVARVVDSGRTPVIVLGDSAIRGTCAAGDNVWTARLQQHLALVDPSLSVINFAQNAGDLLAPYFFYHFYKKFPQAIFVLGWHHTNASMLRHPFHFWLTSEIILRDGRDNPAVAIGLDETPINSTSPTEWLSLVMAAMNIVAPYLDLGNHLRYWAFGNLSISSQHNPILTSLASDTNDEPEISSFTAKPDPKFNTSMSQIYWGVVESLKTFVERPRNEVQKYFDKEYGPAYRDRLLIVTFDINPYFAIPAEPQVLAARDRYWKLLRERMAEVPGLNWTALTAGAGELSVDDFCDIGHLSVPGQAKLAERVANALSAMPAVRNRTKKQGVQ